jgi:predicted PurR-regulated permease PerM
VDRVAAFVSERTPRRVIALVVFGALLYTFQHLAILLLFFVTFQRALGWSSRELAARTKVSRKVCLLALVAVAVGGLAVVAWLGVGKTVRTFTEMQAAFPDRLAELRENALVERIEDQFGGTEKLVESAKHYAGSALSAASAIGHFFVHVLIGFILALVYTLEEEELRAFWARVDARSIGGTLARWLGHVADATIVTVQLQLIVAVFNTVTTLPVLLLLGVPRVGTLMLLIFVSALVPVIGNVVSGTILALLAYQQQGWLGVGIFVGLTFVLHKIESYYLSPRLTARHVKIPGFLLIVSLIACEQVFGFKGFFLSFPILFVAGRIRAEWLEEDAITSGGDLLLNDALDQLPDDMIGGRETAIPLERNAPPPASMPPSARGSFSPAESTPPEADAP